MRSLIAVIAFCSLEFSAWSCSDGCAQDALLRRTKLNARVEAEVSEFARNTPVDPHLQERIGGFAAVFRNLPGRFAWNLIALRFPVDWLVHSEIVWPLTDAGLVSSHVPGAELVPSSSDSIVVVLRYGIDDNPKKEIAGEQDSIHRTLDEMKLSGPMFARKGSDLESRVLYVRDFSSESKDTTATIVIRCRLRQQQTGRISELVALEEWLFQPTDDKQQRCWKRIDTQHHLCPGDDEREQSPDKNGRNRSSTPKF